MAANKTDFEKQEEQLRSVLLRGLIGFFIALASLLFALFMPFYPLSFAVILAIALGALAYRAPSISLGLMFFLNMPGYIYQGGFPIGVIVAVGLVFLAATLACLNRPGACLVIAAGVIGAIMMFTPLYFLSVPLLVSVILFRARGIATGSPAAILVFLAIYNPFLVLNLNLKEPTDIVPLFQRVILDVKNPIFAIELAQMASQLKNAIGASENVIKYLTIYWPFAPVGRMLGIVLYVIVALSISAAFATLSIFRWLGSRELGTRYLSWIAPTFSLLIADAAFLIPISTLATSFAYTTTLGANVIFLFILATVGIGIAGSAIEYGLKTRDVTLELRQKLNTLMPLVKNGQEELEKKLSSIREQAPSIDFHVEEKLLAVCSQELGYMEGWVSALPETDLQEKIKVFSGINDNLEKAKVTTEQRLIQFYDESKEKYDTFIARSLDLGMTGIEVFAAPTLADLSPQGFDKVKEAQIKLNEAFEKLGQCLVAIGKETAALISAEVDQEFKPFGLDIAQNYLATHHAQESIDSMLSTFLTMRDILETAASGLISREQSIISTWETVIEKEAVPTLKTMGDVELAKKLLALEPSLDKIIVSREESHFTTLVTLVKNIKELNAAIYSIISDVLARIREREKIIEDKVPAGFDWEKNSFLPHKIAEVQEQIIRKPREASLGNRLANIELALNSIGEGVSLIKQYIFENEFLINFANIQYLISLKIEKQGSISTQELPVKEKYAFRYLVLYTRNHYDRVTFDSRQGALKMLDKI